MMNNTAAPADPGAEHTLELDYQNPEDYSDIPDARCIARWIQSALPEQTPCSVTFRVVSQSESRLLNKQYRGKDAATNILSFPFDPPPIPLPVSHLGDLVLCKAVAEQEAQAQAKTVADHWAHLVIHGTLHLQGYDHRDDAEAQAMESLEISLLQQLGIANPYQNHTTITTNGDA